ncbi:hypothetical protein HYC85_001287 [Camellia sinensis]|uniref:Uncharacterized protein n=1 Tax=Camellia sinensis TaxID=4442 RepID=A0A7J7I7G1_CAMSI|nr:hypothetical protein HYC85_001287 [Camellia sinensis]
MKTWKSGHSARSDGLGQLLNLDKVRTAVSGNGEAGVVTEYGNYPKKLQIKLLRKKKKTICKNNFLVEYLLLE